MSRCTMPTSAKSSLTTTSYAVLGLLSVRSWTTYELAKQVQRSLNWFWPRAERKLYDEPKTLAAAGLATAAREFTGQRPRTVYAITEAGRTELRRWLDEPPAPRIAEFEAMLKVFFCDAGSIEQLRATIDEIEADTRARLATLADMVGRTLADGPAFPHRQHISALTLRLQLAQERAVLEWTGWARTQVSGWRDTTDRGRWDDRAALADLHTEIRALLG
jgi:PadR family transcriptional regulator, regulatory protein AphA